LEITEGIRCLHEEFTSRSQLHGRYSLRTFAKHLGVSHTLLSLIMSGKRPLSAKTARLLAERLQLSPERSASLLRNSEELRRTKQHDEKYEYIDLATFNLMSDWVHFAILSLMQTTDTKATPRWIAKRLAINETQAKIALRRLIDIGLLEEKDGRWQQTGKPIKVENKISTRATKKFQRQLLEKAIRSLESDPVEKRNFSSLTLVVDPEQIPYATERIKAFRRDLCAELEARGTPKEVYNLTIQIYPVSKEVK